MKSKQCGGLGFRDIKLFNQALLARQAWRLIEFPESLCARVLKAKYYPHGSLIDTVFGCNFSASWRGIMHGLELLKQGLIWRIGNGNSVRIWHDVENLLTIYLYLKSKWSTLPHVFEFLKTLVTPVRLLHHCQSVDTWRSWIDWL